MPYRDGKSTSDGEVPGKAMLKAMGLFALCVLVFLAWLWLTGKG